MTGSLMLVVPLAADDPYDYDSGTVEVRWISGLLVVLLVGWAVWKRRRQDDRRLRWTKVSGVVVDEIWNAGIGDSSSTYTPVVAFQTVEGVETRGSPRGGMYLGMPIVGREVPVWYDPENPSAFEARIYALDRDGSMALLTAIVPAVVFIALILP